VVRGLDLFRNYFKAHSDKYILIGGTACDLAMSRMDLDFRATKDLDIVLIIEALTTDFVNLLWSFIEEGGYQHRQKTTDKTEFYRFYEPAKAEFPYMLELFSRKPDAIRLSPKSHLTPISIDDEASSLSAILMDDQYYEFIQKGKMISDDLPVISEIYLIPLKAKAFLELTDRKDAGAAIDSRDIKKHKNDVFRLYQILTVDLNVKLPKLIEDDMRVFLKNVSEEPPDLKILGIRSATLDEVIGNLSKIYNL